MDKDQMYFLGQITKPHGLKGEVMFFLDVDVPQEYEQLEMVFVEMGNDLVPYFIENINIRPDGKAIVKLEDFNHINDLDPIIGKRLYLPLSELPELEDGQFYFHEIIGFEIFDVLSNQSIGVIENVLDYPNQALFQINAKGKEVLVPIRNEIIVEVDKKNKVIQIEMPEGLLEIYTN